MAVLIVILTVLVSAISGAIGSYVAIRYVSRFNTDDLQMQIDYLKDTVNINHEKTMKFLKQIDQREINHWNFINEHVKLW